MLNTNVRDAVNFLLSPPRARVWQSVAQTITNSTGTPTAVTFTSEDVDTDTIHSVASNTSRMTIVTPGRYRCTGSVGIAANATGVRTLRLQKNGVTTIAAVRQAGTAAATQYMQITEDILCVTGDYIELTIEQNSGGSLALSNSSDVTYLHVVWVSTT